MKILIPLLFFLLLTIPIYAEKEVIDLQDKTTCQFVSFEMGDYCRTEVDINELDLNKDGKNLIKGLTNSNHAEYLANFSDNIKTFDVRVLEEKLIIEGYIKPATQNYFAYEFEEFILHPWWNSSFLFCTNISVSSLQPNYPAFINISRDDFGAYIDYMQDDFDDLRFVNASCNETGTELAHFQRLYSDNEYTEEDLLLDVNDEISVYYGCVNCSSTSDVESVWGSGIVSYWICDEGTGTTCNDVSGSADINVLTNFEWTTASQRGGYALGFAGSGYGIISNNANLSPTTAFTIVGWVNLNDTGATQTIFEKLSGGNYPYAFRFSSTNYLEDYSTISGAPKHPIGTTAFTGSEGYTLVSVKYNNSYLAVYVNGVLDGSEVSATGSLDNPSVNIYVGSNNGASEYFNGWIDELKFYTRGLSDAEIYSMYAESEPYFEFGGTTNTTPPEEPEPEPNETNITDLCFHIPANAISSIKCFDNNTLQQNWTFGNESCVAYSYCFNGCDNTTMICRLPEYQENLILLLIILIVCFVLYKVFK